MMDQSILSSQTELTPKVSSLTYPQANSSLHIYLCHKDLNKAITRKLYQAFTSEESTHWLAVFTTYLKAKWSEWLFEVSTCPMRAP